ncbi:hypothetical protein LguiB_016202 [Lonicera macranthoides]
MRKSAKSSSKVERNVKERNRRMQMKDLLSMLYSSMQIKPSGEKLPLLALLEQAASYLKQLKVRVEKLKEMKEQLLKESEGMPTTTTTKDEAEIKIVPAVEVKEMGSTVEVNLITGLDKSFMLHQILIVLQEEGAEVMTATYSTTDHRIFYTIHFQALWSRLGIEVSRVQQRLRQLLFSAS